MLPHWEDSSSDDASGTAPRQSETHDLAGTERKVLLATRDLHRKRSASGPQRWGLGAVNRFGGLQGGGAGVCVPDTGVFGSQTESPGNKSVTISGLPQTNRDETPLHVLMLCHSPERSRPGRVSRAQFSSPLMCRLRLPVAPWGPGRCRF